MMRHVLLGSALLLTLLSPASASIVYKWHATCLERVFSVAGAGSNSLGCTQDIQGTFELPDSYVPGTTFGSPTFAGAWFTIYDDVFLPYTGTAFARYALGTSTIHLPETVGVPVGVITNSAMTALFDASGLRFGTELRISIGATEGFTLRGQDVVATLVPEPTPLALCLLPLGYLALRGRRANLPRRGLL